MGILDELFQPIAQSGDVLIDVAIEDDAEASPDRTIKTAPYIRDGDSDDMVHDGTDDEHPVDEHDGEVTDDKPAKKRKTSQEIIEKAKSSEKYQDVQEDLAELAADTVSGNVTWWSIEQNSIDKGADPDFDFTEERLTLHRQIEDDMLPESTVAGRYEAPQAVLMLGKPGAGKSTSKKLFVDTMDVNFAILNNDDIKEKLPEYEGWNAASVHEESSLILEDRILPKAVQNRHHLILDGVGKNTNKMGDIISELVASGYDVHAVHVHVPSDVAVERAWGRFSRSGRYVNLEYVESVGDHPQITYNALKDGSGLSSWVSVSNDVPRGESPVILDQGNAEWSQKRTAKNLTSLWKADQRTPWSEVFGRPE